MLPQPRQDEKLGPIKGPGIRVMSQDFKKQLKGYGLTTANILYRRPDHPWLLQTYVWQKLRLLPRFPELQVFLEFWAEIARRCRAFGHGRAFLPHQTGRDQSSGWHFQAALISDWLHSEG
jgi:uncharacterized protein Usg